MDAVTIALIALGVVALLGFIVLAIREMMRKGASNRPATPAASETRVQSAPRSATPRAREPEAAAPPSPARATRFTEPAVSSLVDADTDLAATEAETEPDVRAAGADVVASTAESEPEPSIEQAPAASGTTTTAVLDDARRSAAARLSVMPTDFDRATAIAIAQCAEDDIDALVSAGMLNADAETQRLSWNEPARETAARSLSPEKSHEVRLSHAEFFATLAHETPPESGSHAGPMPTLVSEADEPHFHAAFDFLAGTPGLERQLLNLVEGFMRAGALHRDPREAIRWHAAALAAARALHDRAAERDALNNLGGAYTDAAEHAHARECYEQATVINRELGDRLGEGRSLGNMGLACHRLGEIAKAVEWYEAVLAIMREVGDRQREGLVFHSLGQAAVDLGDHRKAIGYFEQHLQIVVEAGDQRGEAVVLSSLAAAHAALGEHRAALELFDRQLKITEMIRDLPGEGVALGGMGRANMQLGNPEKAVECFQRQVEVAHLLGDAAAGVVALGQLGVAHEAATRTSKALECFDEQLKVARKIGDRHGEAQALWYAARAVRSRGQVADAITRASAALPLFVETKSEEAEKVRAEIEQWRTQLK